MDAWTQLGEFAVSAMLGLSLAAVLDVSVPQKNAVLRSALEVLIFAVFATAFAGLSARLGFSGARGYRYFGVLQGMILYLKTFRIIVAFFKKVCYNTGKKVLKRAKRKEKLSKNEEK